MDVDAATPLLYVLGDDLALNGPKFGCGLGQCGACTVIVGGRAVRSCITPVGSVGDAEITTLEGLGTSAEPHPLQQAFIDEQAAQCGFCLSGVILTAKALIDRNPQPSDAEIRAALERRPLPLLWERPHVARDQALRTGALRMSMTAHAKGALADARLTRRALLEGLGCAGRRILDGAHRRAPVRCCTRRGRQRMRSTPGLPSASTDGHRLHRQM